MVTPPTPPTPPRRAWYHPVGWGCLFWVFILLLLYILVGLLWAPVWYPWWQ